MCSPTARAKALCCLLVAEGDELLQSRAAQGHRRQVTFPMETSATGGARRARHGNGEGVRAGQRLAPFRVSEPRRRGGRQRDEPFAAACRTSSRGSPSEALRGDDEACAGRRVEELRLDDPRQNRDSASAPLSLPALVAVLDDGALRCGRLDRGRAARRASRGARSRAPGGCGGRPPRSGPRASVRRLPRKPSPRRRSYAFRPRRAEGASGCLLPARARGRDRLRRARRSPARPPSPDRSRRSPPLVRPCAPRRGSNGMRPRRGALDLAGERLASSGAEEARRPARSEITTCSRRRRGGAMFVFRAICSGAPGVTCCAARCGVVTTTASARGRSWPSEMAHVPVPGGNVDDERVESRPSGRRWNCSSARWQHRPAPHDRRVLSREADGHDLAGRP